MFSLKFHSENDLVFCLLKKQKRSQEDLPLFDFAFILNFTKNLAGGQITV